MNLYEYDNITVSGAQEIHLYKLSLCQAHQLTKLYVQKEAGLHASQEKHSKQGGLPIIIITSP